MSEVACWATLPLELKQQIFEHVEDDPDATAATFLNYVLVSKEWQDWFEFSTYENLVINSSRLSDLDRVVGQNPRRQSSVKKITLRVHLKPQPQDKDESNDDYELRLSRRGPTLTAAFVGLLECLKTWTREPHERGLALEIITYFPKQTTDEDEESADGSTQNSANSMGPIPSPEMKLDHLEKPLPNVPIVTSLILRENFYECIKYPMLAALIRNSLTNLKRLHMEGDHLGGHSSRDLIDNGDDITEVVQAFPPTLRSWTFIDPLQPITDAWRVNGDQMPLRHMAAKLESLVFARAVDASDFFGSSLNPVGPGSSRLTWPNLRILSLYSHKIHDQNRDAEVRESILLEAARAVKRMPNIEVFEVWRTRHYDGAVFRYTTTTIHPTRTTSSIKEAAIYVGLGKRSGGRDAAKELWQGNIEYAWETVAETHGRTLSVSFETLSFWSSQPKKRPTNLLLYYEKQVIDWDGSEVRELTEKGEDACVESI